MYNNGHSDDESGRYDTKVSSTASYHDIEASWWQKRWNISDFFFNMLAQKCKEGDYLKQIKKKVWPNQH